jgi:hypothetical protein
MKNRELPGALLSILFHRVAEYLLSTTVWLIDPSATRVYGQLSTTLFGLQIPNRMVHEIKLLRCKQL